jgi:hypothetical protein
VSVKDFKKAYPAALKIAKTEYADVRKAKDVANASSAVAEAVADGVMTRDDIRRMDPPMIAALDALGL